MTDDSAGAPPNAAHKAGRQPRLVATFIILTLSLLAADLGFKAWSFRHVAGEPVVLDRLNPDRPSIPPHDPVTVVPKVLSLRLWTNTGAVFGMGKGAQSFFIVVSMAATVVIGLLFYHSRPDARMVHASLAMILSGALGNLHDRVMFNAVRDMLWLFPHVQLPFGLRWPGGATDLYPWLFNIADAALVVGVGLMMIVMWKSEAPASESKAKGSGADPKKSD